MTTPIERAIASKGRSTQAFRNAVCDALVDLDARTKPAQPASPAPVTPTPAPSSSFTGRAPLPPGWKTVFEDDFPQTCGKGQFRAFYGGRWDAYPNTYMTTDMSGHYEPNNISVIPVDGHTVMACDLIPGSMTSDGKPWGAGPFPKLPGQWADSSLGKRLEMRVRITNPVPGWHCANMFWPDSEQWPRDGEVDFYEFDFNGSIGAFLHLQGATRDNDQIEFRSGRKPTDWHVITAELIGGKSFKLFHDGVQIGTTVTDRVPNTSLHTVLQNESVGSPKEPSAVLYDWISIAVRG